jgi:hypothetical protein
MKIRQLLAGSALTLGVLALLAAVPSQIDFDTTYFATNALPMTLVGNLTNWSKLSTNNIGVTPRTTLTPVNAGVTLDFAAANRYDWIILTGNCTFVSANLSAGKAYNLRVDNPTATNCILTLPSFRFLSGSSSITLGPNNTGVLSAISDASTDTNTVATWLSM